MNLQPILQIPTVNRALIFSLAALVGGVVALAIVGLIKLILLVQWLGFGDASEFRFADIVAATPWWQTLLVPTVGGLIVGIIVQQLPGGRYHGIADVMEACALNSARMQVRSGVAAALAAACSLGVGAPLGREGPAVHIGASLSAWIAEKLSLDRRQSLALLGCGAAAAVTVSFDAPIAAVIFALEVIVGYYTLRVFAPIVIAAMVAVVVRDAFLEGQPLVSIPAYQLNSLWELPLFALLGIAGAGVSWLLICLVGVTQQSWVKVPCPVWIRPAVAGFIIGLIAIKLPDIMNIGTAAILNAMQGQLVASLLVSLLIFKLLTVALAIGSGFAGGVFSPAVYIGAMLGGCFWLVVSAFGLPITDQGAYAVVGTAAVASALLGAPISTILIVFELTRNYEITLGVMTAAAFASTVMQLIGHGSFFRWQLAQRNINIASGRDISLLMTHRVEHLLNQRFTRVSQNASVAELESRLGRERQRVAMLIDEEDHFHGSVTAVELVALTNDMGLDHPASAVTRSAEYAVSSSTNIVAALQAMAENEVEYLPIVDQSGSEAPVLLGVVYKSDLLAEHYDVVKRAREEEFGIT